MSPPAGGKNEVNNDVSKEVQALLARAKAIRDSLPPEPEPQQQLNQVQTIDTTIEGTEAATPSLGYRLYFDIGREDGTWMDPTWGRSGKRIEGTIDVSFQLSRDDGEEDTSRADQDVMSKMVKDNLTGKSSAVRIIDSSPARLRGGFDKMACRGGGYRIDAGNKNRSSTARFYLEVDGTKEGDGAYGDIFIPEGCLYFSLPCFNNGVKQLSSKEGIVTVRQMGWHTGWRREESRIIGVFRAVPIEQAKKRDRF